MDPIKIRKIVEIIGNDKKIKINQREQININWKRMNL